MPKSLKRNIDFFQFTCDICKSQFMLEVSLIRHKIEVHRDIFVKHRNLPFAKCDVKRHGHALEARRRHSEQIKPIKVQTDTRKPNCMNIRKKRKSTLRCRTKSGVQKCLWTDSLLEEEGHPTFIKAYLPFYFHRTKPHRKGFKMSRNKAVQPAATATNCNGEQPHSFVGQPEKAKFHTAQEKFLFNLGLRSNSY